MTLHIIRMVQTQDEIRTEYRKDYALYTELIASTLPWYRRPFFRLKRWLMEEM